MGMYTRLVLNVKLAESHPVVDVVRRMVNGTADDLPDRQPWMLKSSSYYHDNIQCCQLEHDSISHCWKLSVVCDLKDYDGEIDAFLNRIAPAVETDDMAGYVRYEENDIPDLVWFVGGNVVRIKPDMKSPRED